MKKLMLSIVALAATTGTLYAQSYTPDALRFSQTNFGSTSRFKAMGGAQIGVGGDMSSLGANPAGLGLFTKSEFSLTPEFNNMVGNASYLNRQTESTKDRLNLNHLGVVFYSPSYRMRGQDTQKGVVSTVFGIGYNRNNDFGAEFNYEGTNPTNSGADYFSELANSFGIERAGLAEMAYEGFIIDEDADGFFPVTKVNNQQAKNEVRSGSTSELTASAALNISNQVYVGASIGLVNVRYLNDSEFVESGVTTAVENTPYSFSLRQSQESTGSGYNARLGVIFRAADNLRIGATLQSPTWLFIQDNTTMVLDSRIASGQDAGTYTNQPVNYIFNYRLRTPLKGALGASYVVGGKALISADIDFVDYSSIRFDTDQGIEPETIMEENDIVRKSYKSAVNYRIGAEYKVNSLFSLRVGYGLNGSAIKGDTDYFSSNYYTGGLGYRVNNYYLDFAFQRVETNTDLAPYELADF
ncbi:MAG: hypothetical protein EOO89_23510, partial [Pedobacter sp.]